MVDAFEKGVVDGIMGYVPPVRQAMLVYGALMCGQMDLAEQYATPMTDIGKYENITNAFWPPPSFLVWARLGAWSKIMEHSNANDELCGKWPAYFKVRRLKSELSGAQ